MEILLLKIVVTLLFLVDILLLAACFYMVKCIGLLKEDNEYTTVLLHGYEETFDRMSSRLKALEESHGL